MSNITYKQPQSSGKYVSGYGSKIKSTTEKLDNYGDFSYDEQEAYKKLLSGVTNQQKFTYDPETDSSWDAYRKAYAREGERASANALAQAASATGGNPSSYAVGAAQQAANYYAGQAADILPTLRQNAYTEYLGDFNNRMSALNAMQSDKQFDYNTWLQQYNMLQNSLQNYQNQDATDYQRYLDSWNQDYQIGRDAVADQQWQQTFDYNKGRDAVDDEWRKQQWDHQLEQDYLDNEYRQQTFDYNKSQDAIANRQWQQTFDYNKGRDTVADNQWQQTFDYKKGRDSTGDEIDTSLFKGWGKDEWQAYFSTITENSGREAAEDELFALEDIGVITSMMANDIRIMWEE